MHFSDFIVNQKRVPGMEFVGKRSEGIIQTEVEIIFYWLGTVHFTQKTAAKTREFQQLYNFCYKENSMFH
jgi:hypothetical protein